MTTERDQERITIARRTADDYSHNFLPDGAPSLQSVLDRVEAHPDLSPRQRTEMRSAVRCIGDAIAPGMALGTVPAEPARLRNRLSKISAVSLGISDPTWRNRRSLLKKALALADVTRDQFTIELTGRWKELWRAVLDSKDAGLKSGLSRFPRFCQKRGLAPADVTDETIAAYEAALAEGELTRDPHHSAASAARAWNRARERIAGWPDRELHAEDRSRRYALDWSEFPASLERDVDAWLCMTGDDDLFSDDGPATPLAPSTRKDRKGVMLRFASVLVHAGCAPSSLAGLSDLVAIDTVKLGLRWLHENRFGQQKTPGLANIAITLKTAARWYVKVDPAHYDALARIVSQASPRQTGSITEKNRDRLEPLKDMSTLVRFLRVPAELVKQAAKAKSPLRAATEYETALAIALLTLCPVRASNLMSIEMERHIVRHGRGRNARTLLCFPASEVKNHQDLTFELPTALVAMIDRFSEVHRPVLSDRASPHLFVGRVRDGQLDYSALSRRITNALRRHAGIDLTPHGFRHVSCLIYGTHYRNDFEAMRLLLGHKSTNSVLKFYAMLEMDAVHKAYSEVLRTLLGENDD